MFVMAESERVSECGEKGCYEGCLEGLRKDRDKGCEEDREVVASMRWKL